MLRWSRFALTVLTVLPLFMWVSSVSGYIYYVSQPSFFPSKSGSYLTFDGSLLPLTFDTLYRDGSTRWHFNDTWVTSTLDMSITAFHSNSWFNYSVSGVGTQEIHNGSKPSLVMFDGVNKTEGDGWTYSSGTVTVTTTGTDVSLFWNGEAPPNGNNPLYSSTQTSNALVYGENFGLQFYEGQSLGFQEGTKTVVLTMTTGNLTSNQTSIYMHVGGGDFNFKSNESFTMKITFDMDTVKVAGDKGNELRGISSGASIPVDASDVVYIQWSFGAILLLPIKFILGMVGLGSMGGGGIYSVQQIKKKEYYEGFRNGAIFLSIGFAFFLAWLW